MNKYVKILKLADFYLQSALNVPDWMPSWVKEHTAIKQSPEKIEKSFNIDDFSQDITLNSDSIKDILYNTYRDLNNDFIWTIIRKLNDLLTYLNDYIYEYREEDNNDKLQLIVNLRDLIKEFLESNIYESVLYNKLYRNFGAGHKYKAQKGQKFTSFYLLLFKLNNLIFGSEAKYILSLDQIPEFKYYSPIKEKEDVKFTVKFSTDPIDILGMSSRGNWTSCQNIFDGAYKERAIGSAFSKNIGIIYLTDNNDYQGRGPKMISRCLVKLIINVNNNKEAILLEREYPNKKFTNLFENILQSKTYLPIFTTDDSKINEYFFEKNYVVDIKETNRPYHDTEFTTYYKSFSKDYRTFIKQIWDADYELFMKNINNILQFALDEVHWSSEESVSLFVGDLYSKLLEEDYNNAIFTLKKMINETIYDQYSNEKNIKPHHTKNTILFYKILKRL